MGIRQYNKGMGSSIMTIYKVNTYSGKAEFFDSEINFDAEKNAQDYLMEQRATILNKESVRFSICATFINGNNTIWREVAKDDHENTVCQVFNTLTGHYIQCENKTEAYALNEQLQQKFLDAIGLGEVYVVSQEEFLSTNNLYGDEIYTPTIGQSGKDCSWAPLPYSSVYKMLEMLQPTTNDVVYDLGSGDGNILIKAVKKYNCIAFGIEYNNDLFELSKRNAQKENTLNSITFINDDFLSFDFLNATAIIMNLTKEANEKLKPRLEKLPVGTKIVSCYSTIYGWIPEKTDENNSIYMYVIK